MRLRLAFLLLVGSLVTVSASSVNADQGWVGDPGKSWSVPNDADGGMHVQSFIDSRPGAAFSSLVDFSSYNNDRTVNPTCTGINDPNCKSETLNYLSILPVCKSIEDLYCLDEFGLISASGEKVKASFTRNLPSKTENPYEESTKLNLPAGSTGAIFDLPAARHAGGNSYYVSVEVQGNVSKSKGAIVGDFAIKIYPVALERDYSLGFAPAGEPGWFKTEANDPGGAPSGRWGTRGFGFSGNSFCVAGSAMEQLCAQRYAFPAGKKFYAKVRMQKSPSGWLHGRIYQPDISITGAPGKYFFEVSAYPVSVPVVYKMYRYPEMPQELKDQYDFETGFFKPEKAALEAANQIPKNEAFCPGGRSFCTNNPLTRNVIISPLPSDSYGMDQLKIWLPFVKDTATSELGTWSVRTLSSNEIKDAQSCFTDPSKGVTGIVTSNATQYSAGPPSFNKTNQSLEYKVAAPHLTPKGEIFYGSYDLLMRSDVARCVYNFTNAPIKGTISVTSAEGDQKVATESVKEANGWVSLSANGFTYSAPTISVKLSQDKIEVPKLASTEVEAKPSNEAAKPQITAKKKSISCTNGKLTRKVSAINPKCPAGYKKK